MHSIAVLAFTLLSIQMIAGEKPETADASIRKEITRSMGYPSALSGTNAVELVLVSFEVQPCGLITILETNTSNKAFEAYVLEKLRNMRFEPSEGAIMHMKFTFTSKM